MFRRFVVLLAIFGAFAAGSYYAPSFAQQANPPGAAPLPIAPNTPAPGNPTAARPDSFADLAEALLPSVVNISTVQTLGGNKTAADEISPDGAPLPNMPDAPQFPPGSPFEDFFRDFFERGPGGMPNGMGADPLPRRATSLGSGFILDAEGIIITNNHVIENADEIKITLHDNTKLDAELIGRDPKTDLALLRVKTKHKLVPVRWGNSDNARVGDWVLAIGNPFGLGGTVTTGIVSARARDINAGPYDDFIQTDASINRGNSGGPMFNLKGEVIGINTAIYSPSGGSVGIGFAIPSNMAKTIIDQLKTSGSIKRGWIGVRIQNVTDDIAQSLGLERTIGALVSSVELGGPSAAAGIRPGDVILKFNNREISEMRRLPRMVAETPINETVPLNVWRGGREIQLNIKIAELAATETVAEAPAKTAPEPAKPTTLEIKPLGLRLAALTPELRQRFELTDKAKGVLVMEVDANAEASEKGIRAGDLILEAGQENVTQPHEIEARVKATPKGKPLLLLVERAGDARFVALSIGK